MSLPIQHHGKYKTNLLTFKSVITNNLPGCKVVISRLNLQIADAKASLIVSQLTNHFLKLRIESIDNRNINSKNLGYKKFHVYQTGTTRLAKKFLRIIESL